MTDTSIHPTYQHRYRDEDDIAMIVRTEDELGPLVRAGRALRFGYWRPHTFVYLASMEIGADGATLRGIAGDRTVAACRYDGDPDVLLSEWLAHANAARDMDMRDREDGLLRRKLLDEKFKTRYATGPWSGGDVPRHPIAVRLALQNKDNLVHGTWDGKELLREVARLTWQHDRSITLTATGKCRIIHAPVDLDHVTSEWIVFVANARDTMEFEDGLAAVKAELGVVVVANAPFDPLS